MSLKPTYVEVETSPGEGRYVRFNHQLGRGAYKDVWLAYDHEEGKEVAWNQVDMKRLSDDERKRIVSEITLLKNLKHPNIIRFVDAWFDEKNDQMLFITERVLSGTLKEYTKRVKALKLKVLKKWCRQILTALDYLHSHDPPIIHRDIKCDNIFINGNTGGVVVGDFGLSSAKQEAFVRSVIGTPPFMAPEMYEENYNEKVDIYAFGMAVLEMCTKHYPWEECENAVKIWRAVAVEKKKPLILNDITDTPTRCFIELCLMPQEARLGARELLRHPFLAFSESDPRESSISVSVSDPDCKGDAKTKGATTKKTVGPPSPPVAGNDKPPLGAAPAAVSPPAPAQPAAGPTALPIPAAGAKLSTPTVAIPGTPQNQPLGPGDGKATSPGKGQPQPPQPAASPVHAVPMVAGASPGQGKRTLLTVPTPGQTAAMQASITIPTQPPSMPAAVSPQSPPIGVAVGVGVGVSSPPPPSVSPPIISPSSAMASLQSVGAINPVMLPMLGGIPIVQSPLTQFRAVAGVPGVAGVSVSPSVPLYHPPGVAIDPSLYVPPGSAPYPGLAPAQPHDAHEPAQTGSPAVPPAGVSFAQAIQQSGVPAAAGYRPTGPGQMQMPMGLRPSASAVGLASAAPAASVAGPSGPPLNPMPPPQQQPQPEIEPAGRLMKADAVIESSTAETAKMVLTLLYNPKRTRQMKFPYNWQTDTPEMIASEVEQKCATTNAPEASQMIILAIHRAVDPFIAAAHAAVSVPVAVDQVPAATSPPGADRQSPSQMPYIVQQHVVQNPDGSQSHIEMLMSDGSRRVIAPDGSTYLIPPSALPSFAGPGQSLPSVPSPAPGPSAGPPSVFTSPPLPVGVFPVQMGQSAPQIIYAAGMQPFPYSDGQHVPVGSPPPGAQWTTDPTTGTPVLLVPQYAPSVVAPGGPSVPAVPGMSVVPTQPMVQQRSPPKPQPRALEPGPIEDGHKMTNGVGHGEPTAPGEGHTAPKSGELTKMDMEIEVLAQQQAEQQQKLEQLKQKRDRMREASKRAATLKQGETSASPPSAFSPFGGSPGSSSSPSSDAMSPAPPPDQRRASGHARTGSHLPFTVPPPASLMAMPITPVNAAQFISERGIRAALSPGSARSPLRSPIQAPMSERGVRFAADVRGDLTDQKKRQYEEELRAKEAKKQQELEKKKQQAASEAARLESRIMAKIQF